MAKDLHRLEATAALANLFIVRRRLRDAAIRRELDEHYDEVMDRLVRLLRRLHPNIDARAIRELV
jgi:hypothetical protein